VLAASLALLVRTISEPTLGSNVLEQGTDMLALPNAEVETRIVAFIQDNARIWQARCASLDPLIDKKAERLMVAQILVLLGAGATICAAVARALGR
jgi:hypothetical protein